MKKTRSDVNIHLGSDIKVEKKILDHSAVTGGELPYYVINSKDHSTTIFVEQEQLNILVTKLLPYTDPEMYLRALVEDEIAAFPYEEQETLNKEINRIIDYASEEIEESILGAIFRVCHKNQF
jgi:hypothetical protein